MLYLGKKVAIIVYHRSEGRVHNLEGRYSQTIIIDSHKAEPLIVDSATVISSPILPSSTDTTRVTSRSDSKTVYSSLSNPMTTAVKEIEGGKYISISVNFNNSQYTTETVVDICI